MFSNAAVNMGIQMMDADVRELIAVVNNWKQEIRRKDTKIRHMRRDIKLLRKQVQDEKVKVEMYCNVIAALQQKVKELEESHMDVCEEYVSATFYQKGNNNE